MTKLLTLTQLQKLPTAIIHDSLVQKGGAETVFESLTELFPQADLYTGLYDPAIDLPQIIKNRLKQTLNLPTHLARYKTIFKPIFNLYWESLDLSSYQLVITSSDVFSSKAVITRPETLHICYCHSSPKYLYPEHPKFTRLPSLASPVRNVLLSRLRATDFVAAQRPDYLIANSHAVKRRLAKYYRRRAAVIPPPVHLPKHLPKPLKPMHFLVIGNLDANKGLDVVISAFNQIKLPLVILGDGRLAAHYRRSAASNISFEGRVSDHSKVSFIRHTHALIAPAQDEDFGIVALEAMGYGIPVIAHASGGHLETVIPGKTGIFFRQHTAQDLIDTLKRFSQIHFDPLICHRHAQAYSSELFQYKILKFITKTYDQHNA